MDGECDAATTERVRSHLAQCKECSARVATWRDLGERMRREGRAGVAFPAMAAAVRSELARSGAPIHDIKGIHDMKGIHDTTRTVERGTLRFSRGARVAATIAAAIVLFVAFILFPTASAHDDLKELLQLESANRADAMTQIARLESLKIEISAVRQKAFAVRVKGSDRAAVDQGARALLEKAAALEKRLAAVQDRLDREGLLTSKTEGGGR
jgi:anti-sigma factor RsiW